MNIYMYMCVCVCVCVCVCAQLNGYPPSQQSRSRKPLRPYGQWDRHRPYYLTQSVIVHLNYLWNNMPSC